MGRGRVLSSHLADHESTRVDASRRSAPVASADPSTFWIGWCFNGGAADRDVPGVLSVDLARGHYRLRTRPSRPSRLPSASRSQRRGTDDSPPLLSRSPSGAMRSLRRTVSPARGDVSRFNRYPLTRMPVLSGGFDRQHPSASLQLRDAPSRSATPRSSGA